ncbi:hypothetical protein MKEN_01378500 [Mycena kentingensis (nom. inval.)]|nr:hypothetical protein MKEN_01378500 [Mycena kentingensis (nom. inval.)]
MDPALTAILPQLRSLSHTDRILAVLDSLPRYQSLMPPNLPAEDWAALQNGTIGCAHIRGDAELSMMIGVCTRYYYPKTSMNAHNQAHTSLSRKDTLSRIMLKMNISEGEAQSHNVLARAFHQLFVRNARRLCMDPPRLLAVDTCPALRRTLPSGSRTRVATTTAPLVALWPMSTTRLAATAATSATGQRRTNIASSVPPSTANNVTSVVTTATVPTSATSTVPSLFATTGVTNTSTVATNIVPAIATASIPLSATSTVPSIVTTISVTNLTTVNIVPTIATNTIPTNARSSSAASIVNPRDFLIGTVKQSSRYSWCIDEGIRGLAIKLLLDLKHSLLYHLR